MCLALALPSNVMHGNSNGMGDLDIHVGVAGFVFLVAISDFTARISAYGVRGALIYRLHAPNRQSIAF